MISIPAINIDIPDDRIAQRIIEALDYYKRFLTGPSETYDYEMTTDVIKAQLLNKERYYDHT